MKRLITSILLAPVLATAASNDVFITRGSMTLTPDEAHFTASGQGFSTAGHFDWSSFPPPPIGIEYPIAFGDSFEVLFGANSDGALRGMSLIVAGVPWGIPPGPEGGSAIVLVEAQPTAAITGQGTYSVPFVFDAAFFGAPAALIGGNGNCPMVTGCTLWELEGQGTMVLDVEPYPSGSPNTFEPVSATFTFNTPEPSTTSLLVIGFAGLAVLSRRHILRATSPNSP